MNIGHYSNASLPVSACHDNAVTPEHAGMSLPTRCNRVKRGALNGINATSPFSVRMGMGGILEFIPVLRDINPVGLFRRAWRGDAPSPSPAATTTPDGQPTDPTQTMNLPGFRRIVYQGQDAWVRETRLRGFYDLYFPDRLKNPRRAGTLYQSPSGAWHCAGLCGGGATPTTPQPRPGPSHAQTISLPPDSGLSPLIQDLNQTLHVAQQHINRVQIGLNLFREQITTAFDADDNDRLFLLAQEIPRHSERLRELLRHLEAVRRTLSNARQQIRLWRDQHPGTTVTPGEVAHYLDEINNRIFNNVHQLITQMNDFLQYLLQLQSSLRSVSNEE